MGERCGAGTPPTDKPEEERRSCSGKIRSGRGSWRLVQLTGRHVLFCRSLKVITSSWTHAAPKKAETGLGGVVCLFWVWQPSAETRTVFVRGFSALRCWTGACQVLPVTSLRMSGRQNKTVIPVVSQECVIAAVA